MLEVVFLQTNLSLNSHSGIHVTFNSLYINSSQFWMGGSHSMNTYVKLLVKFVSLQPYMPWSHHSWLWLHTHTLRCTEIAAIAPWKGIITILSLSPNPLPPYHMHANYQLVDEPIKTDFCPPWLVPHISMRCVTSLLLFFCSFTTGWQPATTKGDVGKLNNIEMKLVKVNKENNCNKPWLSGSGSHPWSRHECNDQSKSGARRAWSRLSGPNPAVRVAQF